MEYTSEHKEEISKEIRKYIIQTMHNKNVEKTREIFGFKYILDKKKG